MKKAKKQARVTVQVRMSVTEKRAFLARAKSLGLSLSAWLRMLAHSNVADKTEGQR
jgi:hypothetical protein